MISSSYGLNDALDILTCNTSDLEHNYPVVKISRPCIFINSNREISPYNHYGKVVYESLESEESSSAVWHFILVDAHYLILHVNKRIRRRFTNILFKTVNLLVPGDIILCPLFTFFIDSLLRVN